MEIFTGHGEETKEKVVSLHVCVCVCAASVLLVREMILSLIQLFLKISPNLF